MSYKPYHEMTEDEKIIYHARGLAIADDRRYFFHNDEITEPRLRAIKLAYLFELRKETPQVGIVKTLEPKLRRYAIALEAIDPKSVDCPECHATAGHYCKRPSGHSGPLIAPHKMRQQEALREWLKESDPLLNRMVWEDEERRARFTKRVDLDLLEVQAEKERKEAQRRARLGDLPGQTKMF